MSKLDDLEKLADAATPGPWVANGVPYDGTEDPCVTTYGRMYICQTVYDMQSVTQWHNVDADTEFIAACNPQTIKQIVALIRKMGDALAVADIQLGQSSRAVLSAIDAIESFERGEP